MSPEQATAYVQAQTTCAMIEAMGMYAENQQRLSNGYSVAYGEEAFNALIEKYNIHHNGVIGLYHEVGG